MCFKYDQRATIGEICILVNSTHANWEQSAEDTMKRISSIENLDLEGRLLSPYVKLRGGTFVTSALTKRLGEMYHTRGKLYQVQTYMAETTQDTKRMRESCIQTFKGMQILWTPLSKVYFGSLQLSKRKTISSFLQNEGLEVNIVLIQTC